MGTGAPFFLLFSPFFVIFFLFFYFRFRPVRCNPNGRNGANSRRFDTQKAKKKKMEAPPGQKKEKKKNLQKKEKKGNEEGRTNEEPIEGPSFPFSFFCVVVVVALKKREKGPFFFVFFWIIFYCRTDRVRNNRMISPTARHSKITPLPSFLNRWTVFFLFFL